MSVIPMDDMEILKELMAKPITTVLTLRDHFALAALAALVHTSGDWDWNAGSSDEFAEKAYEFADAMVKARGVGT